MTEWKGMFLESQRGQLTIASTQAVFLHRLLDPVRECFWRAIARAPARDQRPAQEMERRWWPRGGWISQSPRARRAAELEYVYGADSDGADHARGPSAYRIREPH
jgi:hypothetical protein